MLDASALHNALRSEGLVPPEEDIHLLACSNRWRHALERVEAALDLPDVEELETEIESLENDVESAESDASIARSDLEEAQESLREAEAERDRALERAVELEAELAKLKGTP